MQSIIDIPIFLQKENDKKKRKENRDWHTSKEGGTRENEWPHAST